LKFTRIIPRLDIKGPNLVKGIHLEGLRTLGRPEDFAAFYYAQGADELIFQDTVASLYERNSLTDVISRTAKDIFIPLTVGGGIRTLEDISNVLRAGADKVAINTAAIQRPDLINEAASMFGSSTIIVAIEASRQPNGTYLAFTDNGREHTGVDVIPWIEEAEKRGAGEILLTSIDKEGTGQGFDHDLINIATRSSSIPIIAHGGAADISHVTDAVRETQVDAVAIASMLHYPALATILSEPSTEEGNSEFLRTQKPITRYGQEQLAEIKKLLKENGLSIREVAKC
jgi:cyclase